MDKQTSGNGISGKVVVVTGASSGAGRAIALEFAHKGAILVLGARREEALDQVVEECRAFGAKAIYIKTDVTDAKAVKQLADAAQKFGGCIDVWVNNAGVLAAGPFEETPVEVHDQVIKTNLMGYLHGAYAAIPIFKQQGYGTLINNISVGGWFPTPYGVGYAASKFGLRGFAQALQGELHRFSRIHICNVYPAFLDTPGIQHAANYTGRVLKPAPPVYDPQRVARTIVSLATRPRESVMVGGVAPLLRMAHAFLPHISGRLTAGFMESYLKVAEPIPFTSGNVFEPVEYGTSIHGGWRTGARPRKQAITGALLVAGIAAGLLLLGRR